MKDRISKDGNRIVVTEYEVRDIDEFGDAKNVDHYGSLKEAMVAANRLIADGSKAAVVEKHVSRRPAFLFPGKADIYSTRATLGDSGALREGGWL